MGRDEEIARLAEKAGRGDEIAFASLVRWTEGLVNGVVGRLLGDPHETEEVAQEVYVDAYRALARWEPGAKFTTWLYRAATNAALEKRRSRTRYRRHLAEAAATRRETAAEAPDASRGPEGAELALAVREAVDALPDGQRATFVLRHYQDLPLAEIARARGVAIGTVKAQLSQAVTNLRRALGPWLGTALGEGSGKSEERT
ncbi:MAG: sigma-70 family RNA polymerase sigma factor [Planctomycetes bacterium]|nr:sigma-70 family RNA polymerase sigma factor [Planctomycetota bacterium]